MKCISRCWLSLRWWQREILHSS